MISEKIQKVLDLQPNFSPTKSPAMDERRILVEQGIVDALSEALTHVLGETDWLVSGSNGIGNNAVVPWVRLFKREYSPSAKQGYDLVFLFSTEGSHVYLSLNQGTSQTKKEQVQVATARAQQELLNDSNLERIFGQQIASKIDIDLEKPTGLSKTYVQGDIVHFKYESGKIPGDEKLVKDVISMLDALDHIYEKIGKPSEKMETFEKEELLGLKRSTHWSVDDLQELLVSLQDESPQVVLAGPPGTGKTFVARHVAAHILGTPGDVQNPAISVVQFHPSYGYEQFIEGLQPVSNESGNFDFQNVAGEIVRLVEKIEEDGLPRVLIIDEMNRANLPRVFGELMYLLEYRDSEINLMHREAFSLPRELYIIGTMNTADRSTRSIDIALRRRFDFYEVFPDVSILRAHYESGQNSNLVGEELYSGFEELNRRLTERLSKHFTVGHSYFMQKEFSAQDLRRVWKHQVFPLIEEYFFSSPTELENFPLKDFFPSV